MKRVAVVQSNYIPWKGYFDLIASVDEFVFYDEVQYTKNDWRNRNRIKTPQGAQWLTIPVHGSMQQAVRDIEVSAAGWGRLHWKSLAANYARAPFFDAVATWLQPLYCEREWPHLSEVNHALVSAICGYLRIRTRLSDSSHYTLEGDRNQRLVSLCTQAGAAVYVSGPNARAYLDEMAFARAGVEVAWFDYAGYPHYPQLWGGPFIHELSILDLLFNCGPQAGQYMKHPPS